LLNKFYNKLEFIASGFLNKIINYSILRFNLSLLDYYLSFKLCLKKASLKQLKKKIKQAFAKAKEEKQ
jgi:hypothetical protein